jgi:hypothetical protein
MKPTTEYLQILARVKHSKHQREVFLKQLKDKYNFYLNRCLQETDPYQKFMYSGRVLQLQEDLECFEEAENILRKRSR